MKGVSPLSFSRQFDSFFYDSFFKKFINNYEFYNS